MTGKVTGIGLVGLAQMLLFGTVGVSLAVSLGLLHVSISAAVGTVVWLVVWYLLGFVFYAFALAAAGALVSRQEDASTVVMPVLIPMPMRLAMGSVPAWETIASIVLTAAAIPLLAGLAGRIYGNAVLRAGARVTLSQAIRAS
jgi:ABC-2 type transport system permease protein